MTGRQQVLTGPCRQVCLQLSQAGRHADAMLTGDIVSQESLVLLADGCFTQGQMADLFVRFLGQSFHVCGEVQSCQAHDDQYRLVFRLCHENTLQTRMLLQLSKVEQYRHEMAGQGRDLSIDEAACEWVALFAGKFAEEFDA